MRWRIKPPWHERQAGWLPWFAWRPVQTEFGTWLWLEWCYRRNLSWGVYQAPWEYRLKERRHT